MSKNQTWLNNSSFTVETQVSVQSISSDEKLDLHKTVEKHDYGRRRKDRSKDKMKKKKKKKKNHHKEPHKSKLSR